MVSDDRGQVYTLEGIVAALIVMAGLLFALQATTATPQAGGISNPQAQEQDRTVVRDVLTGIDDDALREAALYWDGGAFHCTPGGLAYYPAPDTSQTGSGGCPADTDPRAEWVPPTEFGGRLAHHLGSGYSYNVYVAYYDDGNITRQPMVFQGQPGDGVVRASRSVALANDTALYEADRSRSSTDTVSETDFYATDGEGPPRVLFVEVVAWSG